jgi:hypothetical protein
VDNQDNNQQAVQVNSGQLPTLTGNSEYPEGMLLDLRMSSHLNLKQIDRKKGRKNQKKLFTSNHDDDPEGGELDAIIY